MNDLNQEPTIDLINDQMLARFIPDEIIPIIVEVPQPDGPFGARGVGEHTMIGAAPVIANAVYDALGVRITSMPITQEKVAMAILDDSKN